ncbi:MAG: hypothetical protein FIA99_04230 [Ruminiclostridium sp.]|nr:hypothetical protein [Ruminiclostridium sp.]
MMGQTTKRDIVKLAIAHKETGRVPYAIHFTPEAEELIQPYFPDEDLQLAIGNDVYRIAPPWWQWCNVPESYSGYASPEVLPDTVGTGCYEDFFAKIKEVKQKTGCYILTAIYGSHFEKANFARGIENFLADMAGEPDFAEKLLKFIIKKNMVMLENIAACPDIDGILLGSDWGSQRGILMSPGIWRKLIRDGERQEYDLIKKYGKDVWIHSCGDIEPIIPDLIEMGVDVLNPIQPECMDIYKLKEKYGDRLAFWGGISTQNVLPYGTPYEVMEETKAVVAAMSKGGGYIASPAQEIQDDVPVENVLALIEQLKRI